MPNPGPNPGPSDEPVHGPDALSPDLRPVAAGGPGPVADAVPAAAEPSADTMTSARVPSADTMTSARVPGADPVPPEPLGPGPVADAVSVAAEPSPGTATSIGGPGSGTVPPEPLGRDAPTSAANEGGPQRADPAPVSPPDAATTVAAGPNAPAPNAPAPDAPAPVESDGDRPSWVVQNLTLDRVEVLGSGRTLHLSPLERLELKSGDAACFDRPAMRDNAALSVRDLDRGDDPNELLGRVAGVGWLVGIAGVIAWVNLEGRTLLMVLAGLVLTGVLISAVALRGWRDVAAEARQRLLLTCVVLVGAALPGFASWLALGRPTSFTQLADADAALVLGQALQSVFLTVAALTPGLLYFLFDRQRGATLRDIFARSILKLDRSLTSLRDVEAAYGLQMEESFGRARDERPIRLAQGVRAPVVLATLVLTLGWTLVLVDPVAAGRPAEGGDVRAQLLALFEPAQAAPAFAFLGAYVFGLELVLRAYFRGDLRPKAYSQIVVRVLTAVAASWVLEVLVPAEESNGTAQAVLLASAFLAGIVPQWVIRKVQETLAARGVLARGLPELRETRPLTDIDGIDLWDRTRLAEEGVTNVEALAHHRLVALLLETRIPAPRLVDWTDQAVLRLHVDAGETDGLIERPRGSRRRGARGDARAGVERTTGAADEGAWSPGADAGALAGATPPTADPGGGPVSTPADRPDPATPKPPTRAGRATSAAAAAAEAPEDALLHRLRRHGVRTGTDLLALVDRAEAADAAAGGGTAARDAMLRRLGGSPAGADALDCAVVAIRYETWTPWLLAWHRPIAAGRVTVDARVRGATRP